jgi:F-type H+-transporting ATP synthase subunit e
MQVLRFSALGLGVLYGFNHQRAISAADRSHAAKKEYANKEKLISDAKAEFQRKNNPETLPKGTDKGKGFDCKIRLWSSAHVWVEWGNEYGLLT